MIHFLDSSALAKLFIRETATAQLEVVLNGLEPADIAIAAITPIEIRSALQRRFRNGELDAQELTFAVGLSEALSRRWVSVPLSASTVRFSLQAVERHALRSLDAIQVGSALALQAEIGESGRMLLIACDHRLLASAAAEGLATWNPESGAAPVSLRG